MGRTRLLWGRGRARGGGTALGYTQLGPTPWGGAGSRHTPTAQAAAAATTTAAASATAATVTVMGRATAVTVTVTLLAPATMRTMPVIAGMGMGMCMGSCRWARRRRPRTHAPRGRELWGWEVWDIVWEVWGTRRARLPCGRGTGGTLHRSRRSLRSTAWGACLCLAARGWAACRRSRSA